jgi:uncharacterized protein YcbK (DUF882 family)
MCVKSKQAGRIVLSRRNFLGTMVGASMALAAPGAIASVAASGRDRELSLYNTHTGEKLSATYWSAGRYLDDGLEEINWLLRDHRAGAANPMDPKLLDLLHQLQANTGHPGEFHVISGYRSPATNKMLSKKSSGVAKRSYHMQGMAIDVRLPGYDTAQLRKAAIAMKGGGVGYYSSSDFIHLDTGRVRYW